MTSYFVSPSKRRAKPGADKPERPEKPQKRRPVRALISRLVTAALERMKRSSFVRPRPLVFESLEPRLLLSADFNPVAPTGNLIHHASQSGTLVAGASTISHTLVLDAGQKISVLFDTQDADLRGTVDAPATSVPLWLA